jgi:hypothetical protein
MSIACTTNVDAVPVADTSNCTFDIPVCVTPVVLVTE